MDWFLYDWTIVMKDLNICEKQLLLAEKYFGIIVKPLI